MNIDRLLERENFKGVFKETLESFFNYEKNNINVNWYEDSEYKSNFIVINKLNIIFPYELSSKKIYPYIYHYFFHKNKLRALTQKAFFKLILSKYLRKIYSDFFISINSLDKDLKNNIYMGGNHSISIISLDDNSSTQILKRNFDPIFIVPSIKLRLEFSELPIPRIYSYSFEEYWVKQEWIKGIPINRVGSKSIVDNCILFSNNAMVNLYKKTLKKEIINKWIERLKGDINLSINKLSPLYDDDFRNLLRRIIDDIVDEFFSKDLLNKFIYTSLTHGDYSGSNILIPCNNKSKKESIIIDWDYCKRRFIMYDLLVYMFHARSQNLIFKKIKLFLKNNLNFNYFENYLSKNYCDNYTKKQLVGLFLIEDINTRIIENNIPNLEKTNIDLINYVSQLKNIIGNYESN